MNIYTADDTSASFIVDANVTYTVGQPITSQTTNSSSNATSMLTLNIQLPENGTSLMSNTNITMDSTGNELEFSLQNIPAQTTPYNVTLTASTQDGSQTFTATTQIYRLPSRTDGGSVVKLDNLNGGLQVQDFTTNATAWTPILPYSYYVSWDGYIEKDIMTNVAQFKSYGYNIIHVVPNAGLANEAFNFTEFNTFLDQTDALGLWVMYDMRWTYTNLTSVQSQVSTLQNRKSLLLWYTGDEPDGNSDTLNATKRTYDFIKGMDPYHPISLVLNCYNFYYANYSAGADIIMEDVYPISNNLSWSTQWNTTCNTTYGDCGCDDCVDQGGFTDISNRLDILKEYQTWLGQSPKALWGVPQAFGNETYWPRYPSAGEEYVMALLSINHNAKGIVAWDFPTTDELNNATSKLAQMLTASDVTAMLLGTNAQPLTVSLSGSNTSAAGVDAAAWIVGSSMLVSVVSLEYGSVTGDVSVALPATVGTISAVKWGNGDGLGCGQWDDVDERGTDWEGEDGKVRRLT